MVELVDTIREFIRRHRLFVPGEAVVVGVSGGPDSLCLLHVLHRLAAEYELRLHAAHLHHGLRGDDADADAVFVRALAESWQLPVTVDYADVPALAREHRLAFEEAARRARYEFLARVAREAGARTVAVGHNADDQAETVLMHWLRGSGLAGLRGMLPAAPLADYRLSWAPPADLILVRPLLEVSRSDIEAYCADHGLAPRFDRSNLDTTYFRNWLRHEVLPLLARHNPNVWEVIRRSARVIADDYALLRALLDEAWPNVAREETDERVVLDLAAWRALPPSLQRSALREAIHRLRRSLRNINFVHVENSLLVARDGTTGDQATLPQGLMLTVGYDTLTIAGAGAAQPVPDWPLLPHAGGDGEIPLAVPGLTPLPDSAWSIATRLAGRDDLPRGWETNRDAWQAFLDAGAVGLRPALRARRPGDRFQPMGLGGHSVKLADFLTNVKIPRAVRDRLPLLVTGWGIAWVAGVRVDERAAVRDATEQMLAVRFVRP